MQAETFLNFEQTLRQQVEFVSFDCEAGIVGAMGGTTSPACAVVEMMLMSQAKHVIGIGASSFTLWAVKMMQVGRVSCTQATTQHSFPEVTVIISRTVIV